jgi:hypothetical protein
VRARGDFEAGDSGHGERGVLALDFFEDAALRNGNHHDAGSGLFSGPIAAGKIEGVAQEQFLEADRLSGRGGTEAQGARAKATDGTRSDFEGPYAFVVDAKFGVNGAMGKAKCARGIGGTACDFALCRVREARRRDVNSFFEVGTFERIGLIKNRENSETTFGEQPFDGHFPAGNVALHQNFVEMGFAGGLNLG